MSEKLGLKPKESQIKNECKVQYVVFDNKYLAIYVLHYNSLYNLNYKMN